ncbi:hypothetical protein FHR23_003054 [Stakelama sediminis]|uniref:DUF2384 domain-containing protein n=2 Tax=Stakelama sediminis TaxID=463200 RepID=A0A840Z2V9_9SPHN|nr:hypothetical protein [Stakelama sediminis]MBB5720094.1 hypothetical protein [Stakelama sediminis]
MAFRANRTRPPADQQERQSRIARTAWLTLPDRTMAVAFLNEYHDTLGARPIDLAIESEEGLRAVERVIRNFGESEAGYGKGRDRDRVTGAAPASNLSDALKQHGIDLFPMQHRDIAGGFEDNRPNA